MAKQKVIFKFGTRAEYNALATKQANALYFLLDTHELYRGEVPFGQPTLFTGSRIDPATEAEAILAIIGDAPVKQGDVLIITNSDHSADSYMYSVFDGWIHIGNTTTDSLSARVSALETSVSDLDAILNGTPADPEHDTPAIPGLVDRVGDLESMMQGNIPIFDGTVAGLVPVANAELDNSEKAKRFMNALGNWVEISTGPGGQVIYTDPEGNTYNTVEEYVTYMIENHGEQFWESIDDSD